MIEEFINPFPEFVNERGEGRLKRWFINNGKEDGLCRILSVFPDFETWRYYVKNGGPVMRCSCGNMLEMCGQKRKHHPYCKVCWPSHQKEEMKRRREDTNLKRYGVSHVLRADSPSRKKRDETCIQRYGDLHPMRNQEVRRRQTDTMLEKYGVVSPQQNESVREKTRKTVEERYGGFLHGSLVISDRIKNTLVEKYGVDNPTKNPEVVEKFKNTMRDRFGGIGGASPALRAMVEETSMRKYGVTHPFKSKSNEEKRLKSNRQRVIRERDEKLEALKPFLESKELLESAITDRRFMSKYRIFRSLINEAMDRFGLSIGHTTSIESAIHEILDSLGVSYERTRKILDGGREIDVFIPEKCIGIECNGLYYHSYNPYQKINGPLEKDYHYKKWENASANGIKLLQFWEDDINNRIDVIESIIKNALGFSERVYARRCEVQEIDRETGSEFLDRCHLNGDRVASKYIGLIHNGELISVMSFSKNRFERGEGKFELIRFASELGFSVIGGGSKLINHFLKTTPECVELMSYSDIMLGGGDSYLKMGFEEVGLVPCGYYWTKGGRTKEARQKYQKHKLKGLLETFDEDLSETENMWRNGYRKLYNAGYRKFVLKRAP